ncbi:hypothetical protein SLEP1_g38995 [Rubroshorea leprosula]|uniref:Uncharacterized protein n=1 Tax=Rubroshorea leprosula TaxID=152421 RepID=A0AAV5KZ30_9ROSI|nr:hypothetical protein SLEP1_g38995 [Rubroshorea leprosula]
MWKMMKQHFEEKCWSCGVQAAKVGANEERRAAQLKSSKVQQAKL